MNKEFRKKVLLDYLTLKGRYVTQDEILTDLSSAYGYIQEGTNPHDSTPRLTLTADLAEIRVNGEATVISSRHGIKLADIDTAQRWHERRIKALKRSLAKEYVAVKKLGLDNQIDIDENVVKILEASNG